MARRRAAIICVRIKLAYQVTLLNIYIREKEGGCNLCQNKASVPGHLTTHIHTTIGEKEGSCHPCQNKASAPGHLTKHIHTTNGIIK